MARILYVCEYGTLNGGERSLLAWLPHVKAAGFEPVVLVPARGRFADELRGVSIDVEHWANPTSEQADHRISLARRRENLQAVIKRVAPDIVHANSLSMSRSAGPVAKHLGVRSIGHLRDILRVSGRVIADINQNGNILAVSQATLNWHAAQGLDTSRAKVLYNGVDVQEFAPRAASGCLHRELNLPPTARLVGTIGQIGMRKGTDVFLEAAARLASEWDDLHYVIVGERNSNKDEAIEFERVLHVKADAEPLRGRVHFLGYRDDVHRLLNELAVLVHAARQEPLGRVLIEAAAAGTPVVATDVGGTREILGPHAQLAPADSADEIYRAVSTIIKADETQTSTSKTRQRVVECFAIAASTQRLLQAYL